MDLKPCPFCGGQDLYSSAGFVKCNRCYAVGPICDSPEVAWNKRVEELPKHLSNFIQEVRKVQETGEIPLPPPSFKEWFLTVLYDANEEARAIAPIAALIVVAGLVWKFLIES